MITLREDAPVRRYLMAWLEQNGITAATVDYSLPITIQVQDVDGTEQPMICYTTLPVDDGAGNITPPQEMATPQLTLVPQLLIASADGPTGTVKRAGDYSGELVLVDAEPAP